MLAKNGIEAIIIKASGGLFGVVLGYAVRTAGDW
jgi:hypothetical protein